MPLKKLTNVPRFDTNIFLPSMYIAMRPMRTSDRALIGTADPFGTVLESYTYMHTQIH